MNYERKKKRPTNFTPMKGISATRCTVVYHNISWPEKIKLCFFYIISIKQFRHSQKQREAEQQKTGWIIIKSRATEI